MKMKAFVVRMFLTPSARKLLRSEKTTRLLCTFTCEEVGVTRAGVLGSEGVMGGPPSSIFFWSYFTSSLREAKTPCRGEGGRFHILFTQ